MLTKDPLTRITPDQALAHPYFVKTKHAKPEFPEELPTSQNVPVLSSEAIDNENKETKIV